MRKLVIFFVAAFLPAFSNSVSAEEPPVFTERELSDIFTSGGSVLAKGIADISVPPVAAVSTAVSGVDIDAFCRGRELCFFDDYSRVRGGDRIPQFVKELFERFSAYAQPLNSKETVKISEAISALNGTELGAEICKGLVAGGCNIEALAAKGILLQAKALNDPKMPAQTLLYGGKILIVMNRDAKFDYKKSLSWAVTLSHELSHAEDYKKFKGAMTEKVRLDTEVKAYLGQLETYTELKARNLGEINEPEMDFLVQAWAWKESNIGYPKDFYDDDGLVKAEDIVKGTKGGIGIVRNMVVNYFYADYQLETLDVSDMTHREFCRNIGIRGIGYNKWRAANPVFANPAIFDPVAPSVTPQQPQNPQPSQYPSDDTGGHGSGGGSGVVPPFPFDPNPHWH